MESPTASGEDTGAAAAVKRAPARDSSAHAPPGAGMAAACRHRHPSPQSQVPVEAMALLQA